MEKENLPRGEKFAISTGGKNTWKIHILVSHLVPFIKHNLIGLGVFAEQAVESAHHHHFKVWKRYKRRLDHQEYGVQLKKSVVQFGVGNI